jgi:biopolymer transport protein ExbB
MNPVRQARNVLLWALCLLCALTTKAADTQPAAGKNKPPPAEPETVAKVTAQLNEDIATASDALAAARDGILTEKKQMAAEFQRLREEQRAHETALAVGEAESKELQRQRLELENELRQLRGISRQLLEMSRDFAGSQQLNEILGPDLPTAAALAACTASLRAVDELSAAELGALLRVGHERIDERLGGLRAAGLAYADDGRELHGDYLRYGPLLYFWPPQPALPGLAALRLGSAAPTLFNQLDASDHAALASLQDGAVALSPVDLSMGQAISLRAQRESLLEHYRKGGPLMLPIAILALMCLALILWRVPILLRLPNARAVKRVSEVVALLQAGRVAEAEQLAAGLGRPLSTLVLAGIAARAASRDELEELLYEQTLVLLPPLGRSLSALAVSASAAPLLGLLGTVTGIIHTFQLITVYGSGDARLLSSGISEALITTEAGLLVAIPALLVHAWCTRRVRHMSAHAQEAAICLLNGLSLPQDGAAAAPAAQAALTAATTGRKAATP